MPVISLNLDDIPDAPEPVKDGTYQGVVTGVVLKNSKNTDSQNISWEVTIADGAEEGKRAFHTSNLGKKSEPYTKRTLASFGITGNGVELEFDEDGDLDDDGCMLLSPDLVGEPCTAIVTTTRDKNDKTKTYTSISSLIGPKGEVPTAKANGAPKSSTGLSQGERKRFK